VAGGQGLDAGKLEALAATHKKNQGVPLPTPASTTHSRVPSDPHARCAAVNRQRKIAELVRLGTINSKNLWIVCGATGLNSEVVMKAQAAILAKAD